MTRRWLAALVTGAALALTACGWQTTGADAGTSSTLSASPRNMRIGIPFDQPGLGLRTGNHYSGFDVDVARYIAGRLGADESRITWIEAPNAQRETLVTSGQVDFVVAASPPTDRERARISFAGPYLVVEQDLLVRADDPSITDTPSLEGRRVCSVTGSASARAVKDDHPGVQLQEVALASKCLPLLTAGTVDAVTLDDAVLAGFAAENQYRGRLRLLGTSLAIHDYGIGLRKGDATLCDQATAALRAMIEEGAWQRAFERTLAPTGYLLPEGNPPVPQPCS